MRKNDKEKWIDDVFGSVKGSKRAKPNEDLFDKILNKIEEPEVKIIPLAQIKFAAAAAVILLILNVVILHQRTQMNEINSSELVVDNTDESIISDFKIYD